MVVSGGRSPAVLGGERAFREAVYMTKAALPDEASFRALVGTVFRSRWFTNDGTLVRQLEQRLTGPLGVPWCAAFCNGTIALQAALRCLRLTGEVITTPFTFPATVHAIEWLGLTPVFCDVDPETYNLDAAQAAALVSSQTSALLPVHVFGNPADVAAIGRLARSNGLRVVYDGAHAFGVSYLGKPIGTWGDLSVFSFHATKLFHTAEGGAVVGSDPEHFRSLALLRNFGIVNEEEVRGVGLNGKLSELHAALGLAMLDLVEDEIRARGRLAAQYRERLSSVEGVRFQRLATHAIPNHGYLPIEIDASQFGLTRDEVHVALRAENIITRKYFFPLCSDIDAYRNLPSAQPDRLPVARRLASRILCLPLYGELGSENAEKIADCLLAIRAAAPRVRRALRGGA
jgi:dTDP-4-amino-4,6-dideoxygalactose transaminase